MNMNKVIKYILSLIALVGFLTTAFSGCGVMTSEAESQLSNFKVEPDFGIINGEFDAGQTIKVTVKNTGKKGALTIVPKLSSSEGEWTRQQTLTFEAGESRNLTYFFHEPTINSTNIEGTVKVYP